VLGAANRLRRSSDFATAIRGGRRAARGGLVVHLSVPETEPARPAQDTEPARPAGHLPAPRAGFVVSRAVGDAVTRNRLKRRLRHLVRDRMATLPPGAMLVVRALPTAASREYRELGADLDGALARATNRRRR
jgi:ribonuclease P protein component